MIHIGYYGCDQQLWFDMHGHCADAIIRLLYLLNDRNEQSYLNNLPLQLFHQERHKVHSECLREYHIRMFGREISLESKEFLKIFSRINNFIYYYKLIGIADHKTLWFANCQILNDKIARFNWINWFRSNPFMIYFLLFFKFTISLGIPVLPPPPPEK